MKSALDLLHDAYSQAGRGIQASQYAIFGDLAWLRDMGYVRFVKSWPAETRQYGRASWRNYAKQYGNVNLYEMTDAGFERLKKEGYDVTLHLNQAAE